MLGSFRLSVVAESMFDKINLSSSNIIHVTHIYFVKYLTTTNDVFLISVSKRRKEKGSTAEGVES